MKIVFVGPSIFGLAVDTSGIELLGPARRDDVASAVDRGASVIGIVDGHYEQVPSVWHKEILYALSKGVRVLGAASMGALRAAECASFGMIPVGTIAHAYLSGELYDDEAVALLNAPGELDYMPLTEPLVDVEATAARLVHLGAITRLEQYALLTSARCTFFKDRTLECLTERAGLGARTSTVRAAYAKYKVSRKAIDAAELIVQVRSLPDKRLDSPRSWNLAQSAFWRQRECQPEPALG